MSFSEGIESESCLQLLNSVRYETCPLGGTFLSGLDGLLERCPLHSGDVVEIQGPAASGKTQLMMFFSMVALLPEIWNLQLGPGTPVAVRVGGKGKSVMWMDCTQRFDIRRLAMLLYHHLAATVEQARPKGVLPPTNDIIDEKVKECLSQLLVFQPASTLQLSMTIQRLPELFTRSATKEIAYLVIDGLSEFHWQDEYTRQNTGSTSSKTQVDNGILPKIPLPFPVMRLLLSAIAHVRRDLAPVTLISQWALSQSRLMAQSPEESNVLPFFHSHAFPPYPNVSQQQQYGKQASGQFEKDPLVPLHLPNSDSPTFRFTSHITLHPPKLPIEPTGAKLSDAMKRRKVGRGNGMDDFTAILRDSTGKEVGAWRWDVKKKAIYG